MFIEKKGLGLGLLNIWPPFILLLPFPYALIYLISVALFYITTAFSSWAKPNGILFNFCFTSQMLPLEN